MEQKEKSTNNKNLVLSLLTVIKFLLPSILVIISFRLVQDARYLLLVLVESLIVFFIEDIIAAWNKIVAWLVGVLLLFPIYAQTIVMFFSGGYIQLIMLTNLDSIEALQGRAVQYISAVAILLITLFLPITYIKIPKVKNNVVVLLVSMLAICWAPFVFKTYSTYYNAIDLIQKDKVRRETERRISELTRGDATLLLEEFLSDTVGNGIDKPGNLPHSPNVVIIFTEGLSLNIVTDSRDIMPNVSNYMERGLRFENYYNHTAATYRGIIGQLYSSHQFNNGDTNVLISIQDVLSNEGYYTTLVNPEPNQELFTEYLDNLGFDTMTSGGAEDAILSDEDTYGLVLESLINGTESGNPQLVVAYTFGTHVGNTSETHQFGDGSNRLLNRFHYCDAAFGEFMNDLYESGLAEDTIVVFTADHGTFVEDEYLVTFPEYERFDAFCDTIPLFFFYEGITPGVVDAYGRNSLDLAPTVLDYLDVDSTNYFLGSSLFLPMSESELETIYCIPDTEHMVNTYEGNLRFPTDEEHDSIMEIIERYLSLTRRTDNPVY